MDSFDHHFFFVASFLFSLYARARKSSLVRAKGSISICCIDHKPTRHTLVNNVHPTSYLFPHKMYVHCIVFF